MAHTRQTAAVIMQLTPTPNKFLIASQPDSGSIVVIEVEVWHVLKLLWQSGILISSKQLFVV